MMAEMPFRISADDPQSQSASSEDPDLLELIDALVSAVDIDRSWEVERVAAALEPFGGATLFSGELRLNGAGSSECPCRAEGWL
jgi:hypothetical protein